MVRNTKAKIKRTKKKYNVDLTGSVSLPSIEMFQTREQFNEWKEEMKSFTNRANERYQFKQNQHGVVASKRDLKRIEKKEAKAQKMFEQKLEAQRNKPFFMNGKQVGTQEFKSLWLAKGDIGGFYKWKPFDWENTKDPHAVRKRLKKLDKVLQPNYFETRTNRMKQSFIEELKFSFNAEANQVIDMLQYLQPDDFYELYQMFPDVFDFRLYASENSGGASDIDDLLAMQGYLEDFFQGRIDMDLKQF